MVQTAHLSLTSTQVTTSINAIPSAAVESPSSLPAFSRSGAGGRLRSAGHYFPSAVVPPTLVLLHRPPPRKETRARAAVPEGGGVVLVAALWRLRLGLPGALWTVG